MDAGLLQVARAHPRRPGEADPVRYARRLNLQSQMDMPDSRVDGALLDTTQLALLAGVSKEALDADARFKPLPEALEPVARTHPRLEKEIGRDIHYARRLHALGQAGELSARVLGRALDLGQISLLTGVPMRNLLRDSRLKSALPPATMTGEAQLSKAASTRRARSAPVPKPPPRRPGEPEWKPEVPPRWGTEDQAAYALRLNKLTQSGFALAGPHPGLHEGLARVASAHPRQPEEASDPVAYARRLNLLSKQGVPTALVDDLPLETWQLSPLTGATKRSLDEDPRLKPMPLELVPVALAHPRWPSEIGRDLRYARRLHGMSQQRVPTALVADRPLNQEHLSALSGAALRNIKEDPALQPVSEELAAIARAHPRAGPGTIPDIRYARWLHQQSQQGLATAQVDGQPLSLPQLSLLSGVHEKSLRADPELNPTPAELQPIADAHPRPEGMSRAAYARDLKFLGGLEQHAASLDIPALDFEQLAPFTGIPAVHLRSDPYLNPLPPALWPVAMAHPRLPSDAFDVTYARRLNEESRRGVASARIDGRPLSIPELSALSGAPVGSLNKLADLATNTGTPPSAPV